ncbi:hypothetical protein D3875_07920 [Deinococcus cavernae]|uniref:Uncharacterized protein n=1 Tax=Deinococcus cavernae TaxID=2320857 RepID=A0A418V5X7_9DEIO|nr:hypothetical protein D3875_07920 [Deinococcus cavernae]
MNPTFDIAGQIRHLHIQEIVLLQVSGSRWKHRHLTCYPMRQARTCGQGKECCSERPPGHSEGHFVNL